MLNNNLIPKAPANKVQYLTPTSFAYGIWIFTRVPRQKQFVIKSLSHNAVKDILKDAGFAKRKLGKGFVYVQKTGCIIREVSSEQMKDFFTRYIESIKEPTVFRYGYEMYNMPVEALKEIYLRNDHNIFNDTWLEHLDINSDRILKDTEDEMFFCFKNVIVTVSEDAVLTSKYEELNNLCVWKEQIIERDFYHVEDFSNSHFSQFLKNLTCDNEDRLLTLSTAIGYLLHHYARESEGQAVIFYDEAITDKVAPMGGTGKGVIVNAIKQMRNVCKIDGKHLDSTNRFRWEQITPSTQVAWLDDVKPGFEFSLVHSNLTDGWTIERKNLSQFTLQPVDTPKTVICSNHVLKGDGTTNIRRRFEVEIGDFYSKLIKTGQERPVEDTHGCIFFSEKGWKVDEWDHFFNVMLNCAMLYLRNKLVGYEGNSLPMKRFIDSTDDEFVEWSLGQEFEADTRYNTKNYYKYFLDKCGHRFPFTQHQFTGYIKHFARFKKWGCKSYQSNGVSFFAFSSM